MDSSASLEGWAGADSCGAEPSPRRASTAPQPQAQSAVCSFCDVAAGTATAAVVGEWPEAIAFLDRRPLFLGHTLVVPRVHVEQLADMPPALVGPLWTAVQQVARCVPVALEAQGTFVAMNNIVSQSVPHAHVHVVPRRRGDGLRGFFWPRRSYTGPEELEAVRSAIAATISEQAAQPPN